VDRPGTQAVASPSARGALLSRGVLIASLLAGCSHSLTFTGAWPASQVTVDGRSDDWAGIDSQGIADELYIAAANDAGHVYLLFTTPRADVARTLERAGFTLWVDGKKRAFRVRGRSPAPGGDMGGGGRWGRHDEPEPGGAAPPPDGEARAVGESHVLELGYFTADGRDDRRVIGGDCGAAASMARTEDTWSWEIALPLTSRACPPVALGAAPGAEIVIGLEVLLPEEGKKRPPREVPRESGRRGGGVGTPPGTSPGTTGGSGTGGTWGGGRTGSNRYSGVGETPFAPDPDAPHVRSSSVTEVALKLKLVPPPPGPAPAR